MNEVKKVILFCYAVLYLLVFMHRKHAKMLQQRNGDMSRPKIKDGGKIQKYRGNSMFGEWDAALVKSGL